jgi:hypothetical protein
MFLLVRGYQNLQIFFVCQKLDILLNVNFFTVFNFDVVCTSLLYGTFLILYLFDRSVALLDQV